MQLDRIASEYVLELQLTPSGQANESADFFLERVCVLCLRQGYLWSNLSKRAFARSFAWAKFQMLEVPMSRNSRRSFPTNHRVVIAKYYITLASTRRRTLQYYRSARLALAKWAYLRSLQCGQKPKDRTPPKCASYIFQRKCCTASHPCALPCGLVAFWSKKLDPVAF
jgi:hypothetical protein